MRNEDRQQWFKVKDVFLQNCKDTTCHYCGVPITDKNRSVDHKHPIAKGGGVFDLNNLALCCKRCNRFKSDYDYSYFVENRKQIIEDYYQRIQDKMARREEGEKFASIKKSKNLQDWFTSEVYDPEEEIEIKKFRHQFLSLITVGSKTLTFNFSESLPEGQEEIIKEKVYNFLENFGTPVKVIGCYVDFKGENLLLPNRVIINLDTLSVRVLTLKKEWKTFMDSGILIEEEQK